MMAKLTQYSLAKHRTAAFLIWSCAGFALPSATLYNLCDEHTPIFFFLLLSILDMAIELLPLPVPSHIDKSKFQTFGRQVKGINPAEFTPEEFEELRKALYTVS